MFDCYKKTDDLLENGYIFSQKLTDIGFGILNKFTSNPEKAYHETIQFIKNSNLARSTDKIELGYQEIIGNSNEIVNYSVGVFTKGSDSPRELLFINNIPFKTDTESGNIAPHIQRLLEERNDLLDRLEKLTIFINTNNVFKSLPDDEKILLRLQFEHMRAYCNVLDTRLKLVKITLRQPIIKLELT